MWLSQQGCRQQFKSEGGGELNGASKIVLPVFDPLLLPPPSSSERVPLYSYPLTRLPNLIVLMSNFLFRWSSSILRILTAKKEGKKRKTKEGTRLFQKWLTDSWLAAEEQKVELRVFLRGWCRRGKQTIDMCERG